MGKLLNTIIVSSASIIAFVLIVLGVRKIAVNEYKKYGLFISTIIIALSLGGCDVLKQSDKTTPVNQSNASQGAEYHSERIQTLNSTPEWKRVKAFWQKLDLIVPTEGQDGEFLSRGYSNELSPEEIDEYKAELDQLINGLRNMRQEELLISDTEIELLNKLCTNRVENMSGFSTMMMRMVPPATMTDKDESIRDLERRIDVLVELQDKGTISSDEFIQDLQLVWQDIELFSILDVIITHYPTYYGGFYIDDAGDVTQPRTTEDHINALEQHYQDYLADKESGLENVNQYYPEDLEDKYRDTKKALEEIQAVLPRLNELIENLVTYD